MKTILVIEDHADMRRNIATILEMENFAVITAADGREGLEQARRRRPDVILCDVMMPELDGYGVLAELRKDAGSRQSRSSFSRRRASNVTCARA